MAEVNDLSTTDDSNTVTGWQEGQLPSTVNNTGRADLGLLARYFQHTSGENLLAVTETGVNSLSVSLARSSLTNTASASGSTGYLNGLTLRVEIPSTITGVALLGINGKVKHPLVGPNGATLSSSMILAGSFIDLSFDASAKAWQTLGGFDRGPKTSTDNGLARYNGTGGVLQDTSTWLLGDSGTLSASFNVLYQPTIQDYAEKINAIGAIGGGEQKIDALLGNVVTATVDTATTSLTLTNVPSGAWSCSLVLTNGGSQTLVWPTATLWPGGSAPALTASGVDVLTLFSPDGGTTVYGFEAGLGMS